MKKLTNRADWNWNQENGSGETQEHRGLIRENNDETEENKDTNENN